MLNILYTFGQLVMVLFLAYGVFLIAKSWRNFGQALELAELARSNPYATIGHQQLAREETPVKGRLSRDQGPHGSGDVSGWGGAAA
jgi:hypothetical protein